MNVFRIISGSVIVTSSFIYLIIWANYFNLNHLPSLSSLSPLSSYQSEESQFEAVKEIFRERSEKIRSS